MTMPPGEARSASRRFTMTRSCRGRIFMLGYSFAVRILRTPNGDGSSDCKTLRKYGSRRKETAAERTNGQGAYLRENCRHRCEKAACVGDVPMRAQLHRRWLGMRPTAVLVESAWTLTFTWRGLCTAAHGGSGAADRNRSCLEFKAEGTSHKGSYKRRQAGAWRSPIAIRCVATAISEARPVDFG